MACRFTASPVTAWYRTRRTPGNHSINGHENDRRPHGNHAAAERTNAGNPASETIPEEVVHAMKRHTLHRAVVREGNISQVAPAGG